MMNRVTGPSSTSFDAKAWVGKKKKEYCGLQKLGEAFLESLGHELNFEGLKSDQNRSSHRYRMPKPVIGTPCTCTCLAK